MKINGSLPGNVELMSFMGNFCLALCSFGPPSRALVGLSPGEGWDAIRDAFGVNCKKGAPTETQVAGVKYTGFGVYVDDCVCVI